MPFPEHNATRQIRIYEFEIKSDLRKLQGENAKNLSPDKKKEILDGCIDKVKKIFQLGETIQKETAFWHKKRDGHSG